MAETKTKPTKTSPLKFIQAVDNDTRRKDGLELLQLLGEITGEKAVMWGPSIIGFGQYHYRYDSGHEGDMCIAGFSPRKANLVLYVGASLVDPKLLAKLGKYKTGAACLYINKLDDIDRKVLRQVIEAGIKAIRRQTAAGTA